MPDSFHAYLKKQLLEYVENERKRGVPLAEIEKVLLNAGHDKNIIEEVRLELEQEEAGKKVEKTNNPIEKNIGSQLKNAFSMFMAQASKKDIQSAEKDTEKKESEAIVKEVIEEAEVIEEKTMLESAAFFFYLVLLGVVIFFATGASGSELKNVIIGFLPTILNAFISFAALSIADNVPLYVLIPVGISGAYYAILRFSGLSLFGSLDPEGLGIINFIASFIFNIMIVYIRFVKPRSMKRKVVKNEPKEQEVPTQKSHNIETHHEIHHVSMKREEISELRREFKL
jgi:hypothetical protein